jgi:hypothetical protein
MNIAEGRFAECAERAFAEGSTNFSTIRDALKRRSKRIVDVIIVQRPGMISDREQRVVHNWTVPIAVAERLFLRLQFGPAEIAARSAIARARTIRVRLSNRITRHFLISAVSFPGE